MKPFHQLQPGQAFQDDAGDVFVKLSPGLAQASQTGPHAVAGTFHNFAACEEVFTAPARPLAQALSKALFREARP